jgi:hypothetical protein
MMGSEVLDDMERERRINEDRFLQAEAELRGYKRGIEDAAKWHERKELEALLDRDSVHSQSSVEHFQGIADRHREYAAAIRKLELKTS